MQRNDERRKRRGDSSSSPPADVRGSSKRTKRVASLSPSAVEDTARLASDILDGRSGRVDMAALERKNRAFEAQYKLDRRIRKHSRSDSSNVVRKLSREELEARYLELRDIRETQPERLLRERTEAGDKDRDALQRVVSEYKKLVESAGQQLEADVAQQVDAQLSRSREDASAALEAREAELRNELAEERARGGDGHLRTVVSVYESLTGVRIQMKDWRAGPTAGLMCTAFNSSAKKAVRFELTLDEDVEVVDGEGGETEPEWDFVPGPNAATILPEYMHDEISFPMSGGPRFMTKIIEALLK